MDKQAFIAAVKAAGIVGEGGAGFPAHVKYAADADTVIANGCECEPLLHTDQHHMLHHANEIVRAFSELMQATGAKRGVIALKPSAIGPSSWRCSPTSIPPGMNRPSSAK